MRVRLINSAVAHNLPDLAIKAKDLIIPILSTKLSTNVVAEQLIDFVEQIAVADPQQAIKCLESF